MEWTSLPMPGLLTVASGRKDLKRTSDELFLMFPPTPTPTSFRQLNRSRDGTELTELKGILYLFVCFDLMSEKRMLARIYSCISFL